MKPLVMLNLKSLRQFKEGESSFSEWLVLPTKRQGYQPSIAFMVESIAVVLSLEGRCDAGAQLAGNLTS